MNINPTPALNALGELGNRNHLLFWLLAHIKTDQNSWIVNPAHLRKEAGNPHPGDDRFTVPHDSPTFLYKGLPDPTPTWHTPSLFGAKHWFWIDGETATSDRYKEFDHDYALEEWVHNLRFLIPNLASLEPLLSLWSTPEDLLEHPHDPLSFHKKRSAHDRVRMYEDMMALTPPTPKTVRIIIGFD